MSATTATAPCPHCGTPLPGDAPLGLCPTCLLGGAKAKRVPPKVPGYEILDELGRGGMGVVYRARQAKPDRVVALKMILAGEFAGDEQLSRFRSEVDAAGKLDHPNIVKIYDASGVHDGHPFYVMQLVEGGTLADTEKRAAYRDPRRAAELIVTVARAVAHGHVRGVLHRDLKPANILLDGEGRPYVGDFGVAKVVGAERSTKTGGLLGTPEYMAPEQASGDPAGVTTAADVYALGCILYELFTGRPPLTGGTLPQLLTRIASEEPVPPRKIAPAVDRDLETVCMKALEKDPALRYRSAGSFAEDLERALRGESPLARPSTMTGRLARWARRHPLLAAGSTSAIVLLVAVAGSALSVARAQEEDLRRETLNMNGWVGSSRVDLQACKLEYSIVSPK